MWDLPGPGHNPMSPALAGGLSTTAPPGKPLPLFLDESGYMLINFVYLLKEPAFSFIDLCHCFLCFYFIYFCSDLDVFFLLLTLGFVCLSFCSSFRCNVRLFEIFLVS